jgi:hypothetical protein
MVRLAITTKTIKPTAASPPEVPAWARLAPAAKESARFFGFAAANSTANPPALNGVSVSIAAIHFGWAGVSPGAARLRQHAPLDDCGSAEVAGIEPTGRGSPVPLVLKTRGATRPRSPPAPVYQSGYHRGSARRPGDLP